MADPVSLPIRLRSDVRLVRSGPREFALVDSPNSLYLGLDLEAHRVLRLLESCATIDEVVAGYQVSHGAVVERENVEAQLERLRTLGLLEGPVAPEPHPARLPEPPVDTSLSSDPKANLNAAFDLLVVLFGWLLHPICLVGVAALALLAGTAIVQKWPDWMARQYDTLQGVPFPLVLLTTYLQTLVFFNLPNVLMLGMACRRFGGRVEAFGMQLWQGVVPVFHLDIGDSIPLLTERGRWSLVTAAFATPLALGSFYTLCWAISRDGKAAAFWALSMPVAAAILLLQCNPGSKTSASYWALSLAYEDSRILERARAEALAWLGGPASIEPLTPSDRRWLRFAGLLSYAWSGLLTVAVWAGLAWWFTTRLQGVGAAIVLVMFALFVRSKLSDQSPAIGVASLS